MPNRENAPGVTCSVTPGALLLSVSAVSFQPRALRRAVGAHVKRLRHAVAPEVERVVRVPGLRPGAERQPLRMKLLADGEHFLERVEQVRPLFDQCAPRGPHGRAVAGRVLPEHVAERRHVLLMQRAVEGRVHGVWIGRALGVDVEHREAVIPVAEGDALDALECVVEIARLRGRRVDADADERVCAPRAEDVTVFGVVRRHVQPARGVIVVVLGAVQRVVKGQQRARLTRALGNVHWVVPPIGAVSPRRAGTVWNRRFWRSRPAGGRCAPRARRSRPAARRARR